MKDREMLDVGCWVEGEKSQCFDVPREAIKGVCRWSYLMFRYLLPAFFFVFLFDLAAVDDDVLNRELLTLSSLAFEDLPPTLGAGGSGTASL